MRLPRRGVLIRLFIYVPLFGFLGWRVYEARCSGPAPTAEPEPSADDPLAPYRKTIVLPDGTQQEIVEMTPEQAEAVLGRPLPPELDAEDDGEGGDRSDGGAGSGAAAAAGDRDGDAKGRGAAGDGGAAGDAD